MKIYNFSVKVFWLLSILLIFTSCEKIIVRVSTSKYLFKKYGMVKGKDYKFHSFSEDGLGVVMQTKDSLSIYFKVYNRSNPIIPKLDDDYSYESVLSKEATMLLKQKLSKISSRTGVGLSVSSSESDNKALGKPIKRIPFSMEARGYYRLRYMSIGINCYFNYEDSVQKSKSIINEVISFMNQYKMYGDIDCNFYTDSLLIKYHEKYKKRPYPLLYATEEAEKNKAIESWTYKWTILVPKIGATADKSRLRKKVLDTEVNGIKYYKTVSADSATVKKMEEYELFKKQNTDTVLGMAFVPWNNQTGDKVESGVLVDRNYKQGTGGGGPVKVYKFPSQNSDVVYIAKYPELVWAKKKYQSKEGGGSYKVEWSQVEYDTNMIGYVYFHDFNLFPLYDTDWWWKDGMCWKCGYDTVWGKEYIGKGQYSPLLLRFFPLNKDSSTRDIYFSLDILPFAIGDKIWLDVYECPYKGAKVLEKYIYNDVAYKEYFYKYSPNGDLKDKKVFGLKATHVSSFFDAEPSRNICPWIRVKLDDGRNGYVKGIYFK